MQVGTGTTLPLSPFGARTQVLWRYIDFGEPAYIVVARSTRSTIRERDPVVMRFDSIGDVVWAKVYESPGKDWAHAVSATSDGNFVFAGESGADVGSDVHPRRETHQQWDRDG